MSEWLHRVFAGGRGLARGFLAQFESGSRREAMQATGLILALMVCLLINGCVNMAPSPVSPEQMSAPLLRSSAAGWYGPLLNAGVPQASVWRPDGGFGEADPVVKTEAEKWRQRNRNVVRRLRRKGFSRKRFYTQFADLCQADDILETRRALQNAQVLALTAAERARLDVLTIAAEHAVLTHNAVFACNALATGETSAEWAVAHMRLLEEFRERFGESLGDGVEELSRQEMASCDATGRALVKVVAGDPVLLTFDGPVFRKTDTDNPPQSTEYPASRPDIEGWEEIEREAVPTTAEFPVNVHGDTQYALIGPGLNNIPPDGEISLVVWGATHPCTVAINGSIVGSLSFMGGASQTAAFTVDRNVLVPGKDIVLSLRSAEQQNSIPIRGAFLVHRPAN